MVDWEKRGLPLLWKREIVGKGYQKIIKLSLETKQEKENLRFQK